MPLELFAKVNILRGPADRLHLVRMALSTIERWIPRSMRGRDVRA